MLLIIFHILETLTYLSRSQTGNVKMYIFWSWSQQFKKIKKCPHFNSLVAFYHEKSKLTHKRSKLKLGYINYWIELDMTAIFDFILDVCLVLVYWHTQIYNIHTHMTHLNIISKLVRFYWNKYNKKTWNTINK